MQELLDRIRLKSTILKRYDFTLKALGRCKGGRYSLEQKLTKKGVAMSDFTIEFLKAKLIKKLLPSHPPPNKKKCWSPARPYFFGPTATEQLWLWWGKWSLRSLSKDDFERRTSNGSGAIFLFNMRWFYPIFIAKCLCSYRDDMLGKLAKTIRQEDMKSTSC